MTASALAPSYTSETPGFVPKRNHLATAGPFPGAQIAVQARPQITSANPRAPEIPMSPRRRSRRWVPSLNGCGVHVPHMLVCRCRETRSRESAVLLHASDVVGADRGACVHEDAAVGRGWRRPPRGLSLSANAKSDPGRSRRCSIDEGGAQSSEKQAPARSGSQGTQPAQRFHRVLRKQGLVASRRASGIRYRRPALRRLRGRRRRDLAARSRGSRRWRGRVPSRRRARKPSGACGPRCRPATRRRRAALRRAGADGARR